MEERNTRITYLYRDADNYKTLNEVVIQGTFTDEEIDEMMAVCDQGEYFIPRQVGLPEERFEKLDPQLVRDRKGGFREDLRPMDGARHRQGDPCGVPPHQGHGMGRPGHRLDGRI